jgi:succinyl-CoA synthetase alpha subunit
MVVQTRVKPSEYHDSVSLMQTAQALLKLAGVSDAAVVMGTPANREILASAALLTPEAAAARPDDLVIVVKAVDDWAATRATARAEEMLAARQVGIGRQGQPRAKSLASAVAAHPEANLVVISVAGKYAAGVARTALQHGLQVLVFSDNVSLADEVALKRLASERGLLCMGPDAGTAIINGVALGFANAVPRGSIGLVSASGTGLQGVTCGIARAGAGISQAIGTGSRDLSEAVGGIMMSTGLTALQADPDTDVIVLISKPPSESVADRVLRQIRASDKPTIVCFLGADPGTVERAGGLPATTLAQAAVTAAAAAHGGDPVAALTALEAESVNLIPLAVAEQARLAPGQRALRGLFAGGTFCYEAQVILRGLPEPVLSNAPILETNKLPDSLHSRGHSCIDLGGDEFTQGRLHPMIDPSLRNRRISQEALDPETAVILLDVVLGYGAHPDPAGATVEAIREAHHLAMEEGRHLAFVASVCGTEADPQRLSRQEAVLRDAGVTVTPDNASAARLAGLITQALHS